MDELIDVVNEKGIATGTTCLKSFAHKNGILHASIHVWLYTKQGKILIQKRSKNKDIYPNLWDVSVAGHIGAGESHQTAALREVEEEIGIVLHSHQLQYKGIFIEHHTHPNGLIDHEVHHLYFCEIDRDTNPLQLQRDEVSAVMFIAINQLETQCNNATVFVPHTSSYYTHIINLLRVFSYNEK